MTVFQAIVLGVVQGLSEFLPISSSGHLILVPVMFGWDVQSQSFDIVLHVATLVAVILFFRTKIIQIIRALCNFRKSSTDRNIGLAVIIATLPAAIIGWLYGSRIEHAFRSPQSVAYSLMIGAGILFVADRYSKNRQMTRDISRVTLMDSISIGCAQVLAFIPGMSRSGMTISTGLFRNFSKTAAAEFSFLMSIPIITLAGMDAVRDSVGAGVISESPITLAVGFVAAMLSGLLSIWLTLAVIRKISFVPFVVYRIVIGVIILFLFM